MSPELIFLIAELILAVTGRPPAGTWAIYLGNASGARLCHRTRRGRARPPRARTSPLLDARVAHSSHRYSRSLAQDPMEESDAERTAPIMTWIEAVQELVRVGVSPTTLVIPDDLSFEALALASIPPMQIGDKDSGIVVLARHLGGLGMKTCGSVKGLSKHEIECLTKTALAGKVGGGKQCVGVIVDVASTLLKKVFKNDDDEHLVGGGGNHREQNHREVPRVKPSTGWTASRLNVPIDVLLEGLARYDPAEPNAEYSNPEWKVRRLCPLSAAHTAAAHCCCTLLLHTLSERRQYLNV